MIAGSVNLPISAGGTPPAPAGSGWVRPADRPAVPGLAPQTILVLFGVSPTAPNDYAIRLSTSAGQWRADWGDGETTLHSTNTTAQHIYDFDALDAPVGSEGMKWVWITLTPVAGNITWMNANVRPTARVSRFIPSVYELYIDVPTLTAIDCGGVATPTIQYSLLNILVLKANQIETSSYFFPRAYNLRQLDLDLTKAKTLSNFLYNAGALEQEISAGWFPPEGVACPGFMAPSTTTGNILGVKLSGVCGNFLDGNQTVRKVAVDFGGLTASPASFLNGAYLVEELTITNWPLSVPTLSLTNLSLPAGALEAVMAAAPDRSGTTAGTLTVTGCAGASGISAAAIAVLTAKNWSLVR